MTHRAPGDEDMARELFACYVRQSQYKKQQQVAMQLFRSFKKPQYMCWVVMSLLQQATGPTAKLQLTLAERMVVKARTELGMQDSEVVGLQLYLMRKQGKTKEALDALLAYKEEAGCDTSQPGPLLRDESAAPKAPRDNPADGPDENTKSPSPGIMQPIDALHEEVNLRIELEQWYAV